MKHTTPTKAALALAAVATIFGAAIVTAGPLDPPAGPITGSFKSLDEVEPRTAINAANTPGDNDWSPSLFRITQPGSYYLTGNLTGAAGKHGIEIAASGVTLDLNGFQLLGVPGSLDGVTISLEGLRLIAVVNGTLRNWGGTGVALGALSGATGGRIEGVHSSDNGGQGIFAGQGSAVTNCSTSYNGSVGILTRDGCAIANCSAFDNQGDGILTSDSSVQNCSAMRNDGSGISAFSGCTVTACSVYANSGHGINASFTALITDCSVSYNNLDCILAGDRCVIRGNACMAGGWNADGAGIHVTGTDNRVEANQCNGSDRGIHVTAAGNIIIQNTCSGNTLDWVFVANNQYGPIIDRRAFSTGAVNGFSGNDSLGSTHPNANFSY